MTLYLGFRDQSFAQQYLHVAVVARALEHLLLSQLIDATVADVRPIGRGILDQADRTGRARPRFNTESHAQLDDLFVCPPERQMQKAERIENRMRCLPKRLEQRCESRFSGTRTLGVATHAVDDREQHRIVVARNRDAVLIFFAVPDEAHVRGFDLQLLLLRLLLNLGTIFVELGRLCRKPPMIRSMTGFARRERQFPWGMLAWELKTVNHRFLEIGCRLPEEFRSAEAEFRAAVAASVRRGKVECSLFFRSGVATTSLEVDAPLLASLTQRAERIAAQVGTAARIEIMDILRWPGIVRDASRDMAPMLEAAHGLLGEALLELERFRDSEGGRLQDALEQRCAGLLEFSDRVAERLPEVRARMRTKLRERIAQLVSDVDHDRLEQEIAILAQRLDVDEEIDRLRGHVTEVRKTFGGKESAGRRLDFLMQELNREANTLSSKSQDIETTRFAVDMKVLIEQMREQVQNIE